MAHRSGTYTVAMAEPVKKTNGIQVEQPLYVDEKQDSDALLPTVYVHDGVIEPPVVEKSESEDLSAPKDTLNLVFIVFLIHGIGILMPWNMFITANAYFVDYKLGQNTTNTSDPDEAKVYRDYFLNFLGFVSQTPSVVLNFVNVFMHCGGGGNLSVRILGGILVMFSMFVVTVILAIIDSSTWPAEFFWITMVTVVIINMATGVFQNSIFGSVSILPMSYTNAVILGSNISGTVASILNLISIAIAPDLRTAAIYYFMAAILILLLAFNTYFFLQTRDFYKYHRKKVELSHSDEETVKYQRPPFFYIFKKCYKQHLGVWFVFFVTLTCFPAIQAKIQPYDPNFPVSTKYFTPVFTFLFFNIFALLGNIVSQFEIMRIPGPKYVWIPIALRAVFIPLFVFCNFEPKTRDFPVLITNDWIYIISGVVMAFTSGWYSSLTMMYAPRCVEGKYQGIAGMMSAFFLVFGIFCGVLFSLPVSYLVTELETTPVEATTVFMNTTTPLFTTAASFF